jgi:hypothetical protein
MRIRPVAVLPVAVVSALLLSACGSVEYKDTNAAVDARPECDKSSQHPGDAVPPWCKREASATWNSDSRAEPVDFGKKTP